MKLTRDGKVSYMLIKQKRYIKRWQYELEMMSIEEREVMDSFAEVVWLKGRLSCCQSSQIWNSRLAVVP